MIPGGMVLLGLIGAVPAAVLAGRWARGRQRALGDLLRGVEALSSGRSARPIRGGPFGRLDRLVRSFNEFAPRLEARLATLEADRQLLGAVLGGMTEGVIAVDARRRLLFANDAAGKLFGVGPASVGKLVAELIRSPQIQDAVDATLSGPRPHRVEIVVTGTEGRGVGARVLAVQGTPLPGSPPRGPSWSSTT